MDFFYDRQTENATRLFDALLDFWGGDIPGLSIAEELTRPGLILQFGRPPNRIDLLNQIAGISFDAVWSARQEHRLVSDDDATPIYYISLAHLIANKQAAGRPKDLEDLNYLRGAAGLG